MFPIAQLVKEYKEKGLVSDENAILWRAAMIVLISHDIQSHLDVAELWQTDQALYATGWSPAIGDYEGAAPPLWNLAGSRLIQYRSLLLPAMKRITYSRLLAATAASAPKKPLFVVSMRHDEGDAEGSWFNLAFRQMKERPVSHMRITKGGKDDTIIAPVGSKQFFAAVAAELRSPKLNLFELDPRKNTFGVAIDHPGPRSAVGAKYRFVGRLLGLSLRLQCPFAVEFSPEIWMHLIPDDGKAAEQTSSHAVSQMRKGLFEVVPCAALAMFEWEELGIL